ncbi:hypothetical protein OBBRIDRAFT_342578 [Obba rivulosa]|uniref:Uncharacterized protein n=1 Tax=Obba rivulosa TaxID=1052685 RepID=A0A8E2AIF3_9APHY|nr:hypothetical protein OBBRIDRAFT_342578 [Obba rivulosa]
MRGSFRSRHRPLFSTPCVASYSAARCSAQSALPWCCGIIHTRWSSTLFRMARSSPRGSADVEQGTSSPGYIPLSSAEQWPRTSTCREGSASVLRLAVLAREPCSADTGCPAIGPNGRPHYSYCTRTTLGDGPCPRAPVAVA